MLGTGGNIQFLWMQKSGMISFGIVCLLILLANLTFLFLDPQLPLCAQLISSAASQDAVSVCPGIVMGKMTALTTVMRRTVRTQV